LSIADWRMQTNRRPENVVPCSWDPNEKKITIITNEKAEKQNPILYKTSIMYKNRVAATQRHGS
jgi:hypothetical protein